jgi:hypothetical protein
LCYNVTNARSKGVLVIQCSYGCLSHKSLTQPRAGLKQSPRAWHAKLSVALQTLGFIRSNADSSLFIQQNSADKLIVLVYVAGLIITRSNETSVPKLKADMQRHFSIKDLGKLKYFLGIEMATSSKGVFLNQQKYILDMLQDTEMLYTKLAITPLGSKLQLDSSSKPLPTFTTYQRIVGKSIYLRITRPDIIFVVSLLSQYMHASTAQHLVLQLNILT